VWSARLIVVVVLSALPHTHTHTHTHTHSNPDLDLALDLDSDLVLPLPIPPPPVPVFNINARTVPLSIVRRLQYVSKELTAKRMVPARMHYAKYVLQLMFDATKALLAPASAPVQGLNTSSLKKLQKILETKLGENPRPVKKRRLFTMPYVHNILDFICFEKIYKSATVIEAIPDLFLEDMSEVPLSCFKLSKTLGRELFNYDLSKFTFAEIQHMAAAPCNCHHQAFNDFRDPTTGHVITSDLKFITNPDLRDDMRKGTKFRACREEIPESNEVRCKIDLSVFAFKKKLLEEFDLPEDNHALDAWAQAFMNAINDEVDILVQPPAATRFAHPEIRGWSRQTKNYIKKFKRDFIILATDKSNADFSFECRRHYAHTLLQELVTNGTYAALLPGDTLDLLTAAQVAFLKSHKIKPLKLVKDANNNIRPRRVSHHHASVKAHKNPVSHRFMAGSAEATLKPLSLLLTTAFRGIQQDVESLWLDAFRETPLADSCRRSWIITDSAQVINIVKSINRRARKGKCKLSIKDALRCYDFSTLYTKLELEDLKKRLSALIRSIFARRNRENGRRTQCYLKISNDVCEWVALKPEQAVSDEKIKFLTADIFTAWMVYLIDNTYVNIGDKLYHQVIGIPMGTNCAVFLANYYLFTFEHSWLLKEIRLKHFRRIRECLHTGRYIDDILSVNNFNFDAISKEIYPPSLTLNPEQTSNTVHFLDVRIRKTNDKFCPFVSTIYDKRTNPSYSSLAFTKFPDAKSFIPTKCKFNIITSQCFRFSRRCMSKKAFVYNVAKLTTELANKGYSKNKLYRYTSKFLKRVPTIYNSIKSSVLLRSIRRRTEQLLKSGLSRFDPYV
jgi:hypothetical protein